MRLESVLKSPRYLLAPGGPEEGRPEHGVPPAPCPRPLPPSAAHLRLSSPCQALHPDQLTWAGGGDCTAGE